MSTFKHDEGKNEQESGGGRHKFGELAACSDVRVVRSGCRGVLDEWGSGCEARMAKTLEVT